VHFKGNSKEGRKEGRHIRWMIQFFGKHGADMKVSLAEFWSADIEWRFEYLWSADVKVVVAEFLKA
jgi:hypothetical protein